MNLDALIDEYSEYCTAQGLPHECAYELINGPLPLTVQQVEYLHDYIERWEAVADIDKVNTEQED